MENKHWVVDYQTTFIDLDSSIITSQNRTFDKAQVDELGKQMTKIVNAKLKELCKQEERYPRPKFSDLEFELKFEGYHHDSEGSVMCYTNVFGECRSDQVTFILAVIKKVINNNQTLKDMGLKSFIYEFTG